ncbi:hypothetical protein SISSUDRAFT_1055973 [Sistotremastrum suecicum HHB10207 ss-3]|uniref:Uncharacterized protein n=1 Tax=Sistotremastrum suecicum HHB10207 ss-3 TaxID=1314776 RepID=A0A165XED4_9AGAM|nr:hypothetical protein SISSUDRAFT_1055973 [Sistotremastrum suecicum HHB10207 ss-3]
MEGKVWYPIPLEHQFAVSRGPEYNWMAHRLRGGEWELVVGDRVDGFTRWEFNFRPGEEIYLQMWDWTVYTDPIKEFFVGSAVSLSCEFGIDIHSLRLVTHAGYQTDASITVKQESLIAPSPYIYYFAHPPKHDSNNIDSPPGFWSFSPDPCLPANRIIQDSKIWFRREPRFQYYAITKPVLALLQSFDAYGFLPTSTSPCNSTVNTGDGDGDGNSHEGSPSPSIVQTESHFSVFSRGRHKRTTAGGLFSKFSQNQARGALEG